MAGILVLCPHCEQFSPVFDWEETIGFDLRDDRMHCPSCGMHVSMDTFKQMKEASSPTTSSSNPGFRFRAPGSG